MFLNILDPRGLNLFDLSCCSNAKAYSDVIRSAMSAFSFRFYRLMSKNEEAKAEELK